MSNTAKELLVKMPCPFCGVQLDALLAVLGETVTNHCPACDKVFDLMVKRSEM